MRALYQCGVQNALSVTDSAVALTMPTDVRPTHAIIQVTGADVRWSADPANPPTDTLGIIVAAGSNIEWMDGAMDYTALIDNIQFIRDGASNATVEVAFFAS